MTKATGDWIARRTLALLAHYFTAPLGEQEAKLLAGDWLDALSGATEDEINKACRAHLNGPNRARKPLPGDIRATIASARSAAERQARKPNVRRKPVSPPPAAHTILGRAKAEAERIRRAADERDRLLAERTKRETEKAAQIAAVAAAARRTTDEPDTKH